MKNLRSLACGLALGLVTSLLAGCAPEPPPAPAPAPAPVPKRRVTKKADRPEDFRVVEGPSTYSR